MTVREFLKMVMLAPRLRMCRAWWLQWSGLNGVRPL